MALDAHFGTVLCVGFAAIAPTARDADPTGLATVVRFAADKTSSDDDDSQVGEARLLSEAWAKISQAERLVTFNGAGFDIPFIVVCL